MKEQVFYWHVHHSMLVECCHDYNERADYIRTDKPRGEQKLRLRLFQPVKGNLPLEVIELGRAYNESWRTYEEAKRTYESWLAYNDTERAYDEARRAYDEALNKNMPVVYALHKEECPNCPWDGKIIFPAA